MNKMLKEYIDSLIFENEILIPRRSKQERKKNYVRILHQKIEKYIQDGMQWSLDLSETEIAHFDPKGLTKVDGGLYLSHCNNLTEFSPKDLVTVNGNLSLQFCDELKIFNPPNLKIVYGSLNFTYDYSLTTFTPQNLERVNQRLSFDDCENLKEFNPPKLKYIGGDLDLRGTPFGEQFDVGETADENEAVCRKYLFDTFGLVVSKDILL